MSGLGRRFALMMLISLLPLGLMALSQTTSSLQRAEQTQRLAALGESLRHAEPDLALIRNTQALLSFLATLLGDTAMSDEQCNALLRKISSDQPEWIMIGYVPNAQISQCNTSGRMIALGDDPRSQDLIDAPEPRSFSSTLNTIPGQEKGEGTVLVISHPVFNALGQQNGYVAALLPHQMRDVTRATLDHVSELGAPKTLISFDQNGTILTASAGHEPVEMALPKSHSLSELTAKGEYTFFDQTNEGTKRLFAVLPMPGQIYLMSSWDVADLGWQSQLSLNPFVLLGMTWCIGLAVALWGTERLVLRHLRKLSAAMSNFTFGKRGNQQLQLDDPPQEIAYLADAYRAMTQTIAQDEAAMSELIHQKEELLREVHHRTGNSLQLIASIMRMHRRESDDVQTHALLDSLYDRVMSLSTVHLGLYRISGLSNVPIDQLLNEVITKVDVINSREGRKFLFDSHLSALLLTAQQAVPLSLLLAEILSNLPHLTEGPTKVAIRLDPYGDNQASLSMMLPLETRALLNGRKEGTAALISSRLIRSFVQQLEGELNMRDLANSQGESEHLQVTVSFKIKS